jgi:hemerythrin superfamily protein
MTPDDSADHGPDVAALLTAEHAGFRRDMAEILDEHDSFVCREAFETLARNIVRHEAAEEETVYPVIAQLEGGPELREEALRQEQALAGLLARLLRRLVWRPRGRKTRQLLAEFSSALTDHIVFEDSVLISAIVAFEDERKRQMMGTWLQHAESFAPSRPHPHGPQHLPGLLTVGVALAFVDRARDVGRKLTRPKRRRSS